MRLRLGQVKSAALISYFALAINILVGFLYTPWMVGKIGQANYGLYTLATSVITIFMIDFGLGSAVSRFVSKYRAENNQKAIDNIVSAIYKLYIGIDILIFIILVVIYFLLDVIYVKLDPAEMEKFRTLYLIVAAFNIISFPLSPLNGILNAYEKLVQLKLCSLFERVFSVVLVVITLFFTNDVTMVVGANVITSLITIMLKGIFVSTYTPLKINFREKSKGVYKTLFGFTIWTTVISIMQRFTHSFAPSVLAMTSGSLEIAVYSPAVIIEGYYYTLSTAIQGLFLPRISRFIAKKKEENILRLAIKLGRYQIVTLGLIFIGFICVGKDFMVLWMGPEYAKTYYCTLIIILPTLITATQQIANTTIIAKNLVKYQARCMIITGVLGLAISYILSMFIGAIGVCVGTALASILNTTYMNTIHIRKANINMFEFYKRVYLKAVPTFLISVSASFLLISIINIQGWFGLGLKAACVAIVYSITTALVYFTGTERKKAIDFVKAKVLKRG